jgi:hypothetical protein
VNPAVGGNLMRQGVGVNALQFLQLTIFDYQSRQFMGQRQFFQHRLAGRNPAGRGLAAGNDVERFKAFRHLLRRIDVEFAAGELADLAGETLEILTQLL